MSFPRYPKYKASGVDWLGDVPVGWDVKPLKCNFQLFGGSTPKSENEAFWNGDIPWATPADLGNTESLYISETQRKISADGLQSCATSLVPPNSILLSTRASIGALAITQTAMCTNQGCKSLVPSARVSAKYFGRLLSVCSVELSIRGKGTTFLELSADELARFKTPIPPLPEQTAIAEFLDRETATIDGLIAEQRRLMELLKEKRQAVISHAVTKGLNPHAPMKPSGNLWLGDVPDHWEVGKVKHYFSTCSGGTPNTGQQSLYYSMEGDGFPWVRTTDLNNDFVATVPVYITEQAIKDTACAVLPQGTVMVAMYGGDGTVGKNGLLMFPATINQAVCGLLPSETHDNEYVFRFIQFYRPYWMIGAESSRTDPNISQDRVKNAPFPKPPIAEQHDIVQFLNEKLATFDGLIAEAQRTIDLLQERRTALISAAVTGQIDVRA